MKFSESTKNWISTLSSGVEFWERPLKKIGGQILKFAGHFFRIWPPNFFKGLTQNSIRKLKVEIQFYVDPENFMKKNIETLSSSIIFNEVNCLNIANWDIWSILLIFCDYGHRVFGVYVQIWAYSILLITRSIFIRFW